MTGALIGLLVLLVQAMGAQTSTTLQGAGATFPFPIYQKWFAAYGSKNPQIVINYDAIGSEAGVRRLLKEEVDFGATDSPQIIPELAPNEEGKYLLFPSVIGAVVPIVNLPGFSSEVSLTPRALAGIYSGKIKKWNDPVLKEANRGVQLPDLDIVVIHRSDGSGTTYAWTDYLSQTNPEWKATIGTGLSVQWPVGRAVDGNDGVAKLVKELGGSIGYVEYIYALQNHLSFGRVQNAGGKFVTADLESIAAAAADRVVLDKEFKGSIVNAPGSGAYPIVTFTWLLVPTQIKEGRKRVALADFLTWMLGPGQRQAAMLGYAALPDNVVEREKAQIEKLR